jgi:hypothetical protein
MKLSVELTPEELRTISDALAFTMDAFKSSLEDDEDPTARQLFVGAKAAIDEVLEPGSDAHTQNVFQLEMRRQRSENVLSSYFKGIWSRLGWEWEPDNQAEIRSLIEDIVR